ncbi:type II secretion system protein GspC [Shewanella sp. UCD-KL21]|uniref:type II secretion system protein GspC n=1 Tax=Shewanella sp. UCD-KL21 TaxID=1917164 RepID=UPI0009713B0E|nr:type II secretion system protein GspC [Shewanella sp. UCD-KL21]
MDVLDKVITKVAALPQKQLSVAFFWLGLVIVLSIAAQITWKLMPVNSQAVAWQPSPTSSASAKRIELSGVQQLSLFGKKGVSDSQAKKPAPVEQITDAPKTNLSILLTGVVASTSDSHGLAVIESKGSQETYSLGDKIKGTSASLKEVYADRIIITNAGRYETLMLDGLNYTTQSQANESLQKAKQNRTAQTVQRSVLSQELADSRDELLADPGKLTDYLAISPVRGADGISGYRLNPGKNKSLFASAGFKANDLAKSINGYDLTDMSQSLEVMGQLAELTEIGVMVERDGQLVEIIFSLPE